MNAAHYHLLINHVPILAVFFSVAVLVWGIAAKSEAIKKVALVGFLVAGIFVIAAYQTGESAEDIVEEIPTVTHDTIEAHEEAADITQWLTILLGLAGAAGLYMIAKNVQGLRYYLWVLLLYSIITAGFLAYTAYQGGFIRHTEIVENGVSDGVSTSQDLEVDDD